MSRNHFAAIIVGSRAAKMQFPLWERVPKDWDFIMRLADIHRFSVDYRDKLRYLVAKNEWKFKGLLKTGEHFEIEVADYNPSAQFLWERKEQMSAGYYGDTTFFGDMPVFIPDSQYLRLMKRSHLEWNVHWQKNIQDYHFIKAHCDMRLQKPHDDHLEFYRLRYAENKAKFKPQEVNYEVSNEEFFGRSGKKIIRKYDHDELHRAVMRYDIPVYLMCKVDANRASLDESLFRLLDEDQQLALVREEIEVIALERWIIPKGLESSSSDAYSYAVRRLCTNLSSGWFRDFAIENWPRIANPSIDYVGRFRSHFKV